MKSHNFTPDIIISGLQCGSDLGGLYGAEACGIATGGYCPKGFKTEKGPQPELAARFGLIESHSADFNVRTKQNIEICDAVVIVAYNFKSPGTKITREFALSGRVPIFEISYGPNSEFSQPYLIGDIRSWLRMHRPSVLNIAGNRESKARGIQNFTNRLIRQIFVDSWP